MFSYLYLYSTILSFANIYDINKDVWLPCCSAFAFRQESFASWVPIESPSFMGFALFNLLAFCVVFVDECLSFFLFSFGHCIVCPSMYCSWLLLWYLQTFLVHVHVVFYKYILSLHLIIQSVLLKLWSKLFFLLV
jgi:hypothetical protein